ncbi:MAG: FAD-dependent oxidoreductase [Paracraurococcus sp.]
MTPRVAIIGGGFAGLAAATILARGGATVEIFERAPRLGGLAAGFQDAAWRSGVEHFYHHWFGTDAELRRFLRLWDAEAGLVSARPLTGMETRAHGVVQLDSALSLLRYPEIPLPDRLRMGAALAFLKLLRDPGRLNGVTAAAWCRRWMGRLGFDAIWGPLLRGKFGEHAEQVGMPWLWARLHCRTAALFTYRGGFSALLDHVAGVLRGQGVGIHLDATVDVSREGAGWRVGAQGGFTHVVAACGVRAFREGFGHLAPAHAARLGGERSLGAQVVLLSLRRSLGPWYWTSLRKEGHPFLAVIEHTRMVPPEEFGGEHLVYVAEYLDTADPRWALDDAALTAEALAACARLSPGLGEADLRRAWVFRAAEAQPVMPADVAGTRPPTRVAEAPGLFHASMAHVQPWDRGTNFALELGRRVAEEILAG